MALERTVGLTLDNQLAPERVALAFALAAMTAAGAQAQPNVEELLVRVGERVAEFYKRAKNVICTETSTVQPVDFSNSPAGFARTVESELHVEPDGGQTPAPDAPTQVPCHPNRLRFCYRLTVRSTNSGRRELRKTGTGPL